MKTKAASILSSIATLLLAAAPVSNAFSYDIESEFPGLADEQKLPKNKPSFLEVEMKGYKHDGFFYPSGSVKISGVVYDKKGLSEVCVYENEKERKSRDYNSSCDHFFGSNAATNNFEIRYSLPITEGEDLVLILEAVNTRGRKTTEIISYDCKEKEFTEDDEDSEVYDDLKVHSDLEASLSIKDEKPFYIEGYWMQFNVSVEGGEVDKFALDFTFYKADELNENEAGEMAFNWDLTYSRDEDDNVVSVPLARNFTAGKYFVDMTVTEHAPDLSSGVVLPESTRTGLVDFYVQRNKDKTLDQAYAAVDEVLNSGFVAYLATFGTSYGRFKGDHGEIFIDPFNKRVIYKTTEKLNSEVGKGAQIDFREGGVVNSYEPGADLAADDLIEADLTREIEEILMQFDSLSWDNPVYVVAEGDEKNFDRLFSALFQAGVACQLYQPDTQMGQMFIESAADSGLERDKGDILYVTGQEDFEYGLFDNSPQAIIGLFNALKLVNAISSC